MARETPPKLMWKILEQVRQPPKLTTEEIGKRIGRSQEHVSKLRLIGELDEQVLKKWDKSWDEGFPVPVNAIRMVEE